MEMESPTKSTKRKILRCTTLKIVFLRDTFRNSYSKTDLIFKIYRNIVTFEHDIIVLLGSHLQGLNLAWKLLQFSKNALWGSATSEKYENKILTLRYFAKMINNYLLGELSCKHYLQMLGAEIA